MRLLTILLLSMASLFADTSDRLPNTPKTPPVRAPKRATPGPARIGKAVKGGGNRTRASKRGAPGASIKTRDKAIRIPRSK